MTEGREGELSLGDRRWRWHARPTEPADSAAGPAHFLEWFEFTFRLADDPDQEATSRAGVPRGEWGERTLRSILRSVRERTWRDRDGHLWEIRLSGWPTSGISTEVGAPEREAGPRVIFSRGDDGERAVERAAGDIRSLTEVPDDRLQRLLTDDAPSSDRFKGP